MRANSPDTNTPPPSFSPEERRAFGILFRAADTENLGVVTGDVAVRFFERSGLASSVLGEIWSIADSSNQGFLAPQQFSIAMRLIGHCQAGHRPSPELVKLAGAIPRFDGIDLSTSTSKVAQPQAYSRIPVLGTAERTRYLNMFANIGPTNGLLDGDKARTFFLRTRLPNDVLAQIWSLVDTKKRGQLDSTDFVIAMHLIQCIMNASLKTPPTVLPPGIYDAAAGKSSERKGSLGSRRQSNGLITPSISKQHTGPTSGRQSPMSRQGTGQHYPTGEHLNWDVTPSDQKYYDSLFSSVDTTCKGYITGGEAVSFFLSSNLSEDILAHVWDLADIRREGQLNRDEFAVAMHLIKSKINGKELPDVLPFSLIPPMLRQQSIPPDGKTKSSLNLSTSPKVPDVFRVESPLGLLASQAPGNDVGTPKEAGPVIKSFVPTSSFGQSLASSQAIPQDSLNSDLLGDDTTDLSKKFQDSVDFANVSNQISSLNSATAELRTRRSEAEQEFSDVAAQKHDFEVRLAQVRALYEGEVKIVRQVEDQLSIARGETGRLKQEYAAAESSYKTLQAQHQELSHSLWECQEENSRLRRQIQTIMDQSTKLRAQVQKLEKDTRFQRGTVVINERQVATAEAETEKLQSQVAELSNQVPSPESLAVINHSPTVDTTNPFHRTEKTPPSQSYPFARSPDIFSGAAAQSKNQTFDDVFGNSSESVSSVFSKDSPFGTQEMLENHSVPDDEHRQIGSTSEDIQEVYEQESRSDVPPKPHIASPKEKTSTDVVSISIGDNTAEKTPSDNKIHPFPLVHSQTSSADSQSTFKDSKDGNRDSLALDSHSLFNESPGIAASKFPELDSTESDTFGIVSDSFPSEFPPLAEYECQEGSDSDEPIGFRDNFQPEASFATFANKVSNNSQTLELMTLQHQKAATSSETLPSKLGLEAIPDKVTVKVSEPPIDDFETAFADLADATQVDTDDLGESELSDKFFFDPNFDHIPPRPAKIESKTCDFDGVFADLDAAPSDNSPNTQSSELAQKPSLDDDPRVKELVGMGFQRVAAIDSLEQYNYDLTRASNFLLDQGNKSTE